MREKTKKYACWSAQFHLGGACYGFLEILWRGYTHVSMLLVGGLCFWLLVCISKTRCNFVLKCVLGGLCVTALEFFAGCIVNLWLGLNVWDYSAEPCQFLGQVCLRFSLLWCGLCAVILLCVSISKTVYFRRFETTRLS